MASSYLIPLDIRADVHEELYGSMQTLDQASSQQRVGETANGVNGRSAQTPGFVSRQYHRRNRPPLTSDPRPKWAASSVI
jgi:uncharacterized protein YdbL (DUF1318 family)